MTIWTSPDWKEVWQDLSCDVESFSRLGIAHDTSDRDLWRLCQQEGILLVTGNRNAEDEDSLEATIERIASGASHRNNGVFIAAGSNLPP